MSLRKSIDDMNNNIVGWASDTRKAFVAELDSLGVQHSKNSPNKIPLRRVLKESFRKDFDAIDRITYKMPRSAIFLHKGVSRGHGKRNPRQAKQWYSAVIDKQMNKLEDIVADGQGNMIINNSKF